MSNDRGRLWVKLAVDYLDDDRILLAGPEAELLFVRGLAWAKRDNSGQITRGAMVRLGLGLSDPLQAALTLANAGLWVTTPDGWEIAAWAIWQTTDDQLMKRASAGSLGNHRRWHTNRPSPDCPHCTTVAPESQTDRTCDKPAIPETETEIDLNTSSPAVPQEVDQLCNLLAELMVTNGCKRPTVTKAWRFDMHALNRLDGYGWDEVEAVLRWSQADQFWRTNILSPGKLRKQFDRLRMKMNPAASTGEVPSVPSRPAWVADPTCHTCEGDGWATGHDERGNTTYSPCACRVTA